MDKKIYLAFINKHIPPFWQKIPGDLNCCLPFTFDSLQLKINMKQVYSAERNQYHSTLMLAQILKSLPDDGEKIVGITSVDIYIPILTFLFGEAQLGGRGAIVSTYRLDNKYYGLPEDPGLLYDRTLKEITHELGHTLGLIHCPDFECVMNSSTYVENIDIKKSSFCRNCQKTLGIQCQQE